MINIKKLFNFSGIFDKYPFTKGIGYFVIISLMIFLLGDNILFFEEKYFIFLVLFEIFVIGIILKSFSGLWFEKLWKFKNGFIRNKWLKMKKSKLRFRHIVAFFVNGFLALFHLGNFFILRNNYPYLASEQLSIGIMFLLLFSWFILKGNKTFDNPKEIAFTLFLAGIFMFIYDFALGQLQYVLGYSEWTSNIIFSLLMPIGLLIYLFFPESSIL